MTKREYIYLMKENGFIEIEDVTESEKDYPDVIKDTIVIGVDKQYKYRKITHVFSQDEINNIIKIKQMNYLKYIFIILLIFLCLTVIGGLMIYSGINAL